MRVRVSLEAPNIMKQILVRKNFEFDDRSRTISYDLYVTGRKAPMRQNTPRLTTKEYFIRKLKGR